VGTMKLMYVYIIECGDGSFYTGVTNNLGRRFIEHLTGVNENSYTADKKPLKLVFCREFERPIAAIKFEKQLKGWSRLKKIALINGDIAELKKLAECKNESHYKNLIPKSDNSQDRKNDQGSE
jgi:putative endonuclease